MKTSIFDMNFTLPPMLKMVQVMVQVEKEMVVYSIVRSTCMNITDCMNI